EDAENETQVLSMRFASSVIGPMGTTIDPNFDEDDYDGEDDAEYESESARQGRRNDGVAFSKDPFSAGMAGATVEGKGKEKEKEEKKKDDDDDSVGMSASLTVTSWSV
ncbi:hypothetical protein C0991_005148, partial [Blastosporella zonata]